MINTEQHQRYISLIQRLKTGCVLALAAMFLAGIGTPSAQAQTLSTLHTFAGPTTDGANPYAGLVFDSSGNLYGTTGYGGASSAGTVFERPKSGGSKILYSFTGGSDGANPFASLILDGGILYGTTYNGGAFGYGVVFKLDNGTETVLYSFTGGADGANPYASLLPDSAGNVYGTTASGGASGYGVVFKVSKTGTETVLYSFTGGTDGATPYGRLIRDSAGNFYGTTYDGGAYGYGVVFKLYKKEETVLYSFSGGADGANPYAGLVRDSSGNLYGTTSHAGASDSGVVFELDTAGTETVLYTFTGGTDGAFPYAGLVRDSSGNLYGTTYGGGASSSGVVFEVNTSGGETVLHSFTGLTDGGSPLAGLIEDKSGNLYGTAYLGGTSEYGTTFKLKP
jgi:uncharacterized repeat protein (TIGR03803 family)